MSLIIPIIPIISVIPVSSFVILDYVPTSLRPRSCKLVGWGRVVAQVAVKPLWDCTNHPVPIHTGFQARTLL